MNTIASKFGPLSRTHEPLRLLQQEDGNALVETALSLTLLVSCMFSIIGFSQVIYAKHFVAFAARQGTRYAVVRGSTFAGASCAGSNYACQATAADVSNFILARVPLGLSRSAVTVTTSWPGLVTSGLSCLTLNGTNSPGCEVQVTVKYSFHYKLPYLPRSVGFLQSTSALVIAQ